MTTKLSTTLFLFLVFLLQGCNNTPQEDAEKPNVLIVLFDDLGYDDLGVHGNEIIETPNVDAMAENGVQFDNFYVNPVCAASRASLLTGRFFLRTGVSHVHGGKDFLALDETTLGDVFSKNGYSTAIWGKWHTGDAYEYYPWQRGFGEAFKARLYKHRNAEGEFNGKPVSTNKWADKVIADYATDFLQRHRKKPFFAFVSLLAPHTPLDAPESVVQKYIDKGLSQNLATLYGMVDYSDQQLGRIFNTLEETGLDENTIVLIMSDNGPAVNRRQLSDKDREIRYVNNYRGHKGDIWENGVKSPLFVKWGDNLKKRTIEELVDITDIFPTLVDITGIAHEPEKQIDGASFKNLLFENSREQKKVSFNYANRAWPPSHEPYDPDGKYEEYRPVDKDTINPWRQVISIRTPRYKLLRNPGIEGNFNTPDSVVLIDMQKDPKETTNIVDQHPQVVAELNESLLNWYENILQGNNSYKAPVMHLQPNSPTEIKATSLADLSENLLNTVTAVKKWGHKNDRAEYLVNAPRQGKHEIELTYQKSHDRLVEGIISSPLEKTPFVLNENQETKSPVIMLKKGRNTIEINIPAEGASNSISELKSLKFTPVEIIDREP